MKALKQMCSHYGINYSVVKKEDFGYPDWRNKYVYECCLIDPKTFEKVTDLIYIHDENEIENILIEELESYVAHEMLKDMGEDRDECMCCDKDEIIKDLENLIDELEEDDIDNQKIISELRKQVEGLEKIIDETIDNTVIHILSYLKDMKDRASKPNKKILVTLEDVIKWLEGVKDLLIKDKIK